MFHIPRPHFTSAVAPSPRLAHLSMSLLLALAGGLAMLGLLVSRGALPPVAAPSDGPSQAQIIAAVNQYLNEWQPLRDPLVTLENGVQVKSSNVNGIDIDGRSYYYRLLNAVSYDPVSRGEAGDYVTVVVLDPGTQWEVVIYRLR